MSQVSILIGSKSDMPVAEGAVNILKEFGVPCSLNITSAHRSHRRTGPTAPLRQSIIVIILDGIGCPGRVGLDAYQALPAVEVPVCMGIAPESPAHVCYGF